MIFISNSAEETKKIGYEFAKKLDTDATHSAYIAMRGEMGVGKTAFTAGFASYFEISGVKSPTYAVMNQHTGRDGIKIFHFDMYRIESEDDLYSIGYDDFVDVGGYTIVEWSENIEYAIPSDAFYVTISRVDGNESAREISITGGAL